MTSRSYELYFTDEQFMGVSIDGKEFIPRLTKDGLLDRCLSLESPVVKGWLANPNTYPDELKKVSPFLLGSRGRVGSKCSSPRLVCDHGGMRVIQDLLDYNQWDNRFPILLEP